MRNLLLGLIFTTLFIGGLAAGQAQEKAILATPEVISATRTDYLVYRIVAQRAVPEIGKDWTFEIWWMDNLGHEFNDIHQGPDIPADPLATPPTEAVTGGQFYVNVFNTLDFASRSLVCRALDHLKSEGKIPATAVVCGG